MNSKSRRFLLYILLAVMVVTQVAFVKTEENNTSDESVVYNTNSTDETEDATDAEKEVDATYEVPSITETEEVVVEEGTQSTVAGNDSTADAQVSRMVVVAEQTYGTADAAIAADLSGNETANESYLGVSNDTEVSDYQDMIVSYADPYLPVRTEADRDSTTVGKLYPGSYADIVERGDEWTKIKSGNVEGYIQNIYVCFDEEAEDLAEQLGGTLSTGITIAEEKKAAEEAAKKKAQQTAGAGSVSAMSASAYEVCLLAAIIDWEANAEPYDGKVAVGRVVLNRVASPKFGSSIEAVLSARGQFGGVTDGNGNWSARFQERINKYVNGASNDCLKAAQDALAGANPLNATYYYFNTVVGSCSQWQQIGNHTFYNY